MLTLVFVARHFTHSVAPVEGLHDHFLFDGGDVLCEVKGAEDFGAEGAEAILAFAELHAKSLVDTGGDEGTAHQTEEFVEPTVQFARAAHQTGCGNVIGLVPVDQLDEFGNVIGIVGAIGVDKDGDFPLE